MIEIYNADNTNFEFNGNQTLFPTLCDISPELNGVWQMELRHPIDDEERYKSIVENAVIKAPSFNGDQLFRIYEKNLTNDEVTAYATPIFLDARDEIMLLDCRPTLLNGQNALNWMLSGQSKYTAQSDITKSGTAYYVRKNFIEAVAGNDDNAFLKRWGGEIYYDNYEIIIDERVGSDRGVSVIYGKNLSAIEENVDTSEIITRIIPEAYNGYMLAGNTPWVDSDLIDTYPKVYSRVVKFDDVRMIEDATEDIPGYETIEELRAELIRRCGLMYSQDEVDKPMVSMNVEMIQLSQTEEYKDYIMLEDVALGDTIRVIHDRYGIESEARVIALTYDCIEEKNKSVTIGVQRYNIMDAISDVKSKIDAVISEDTGDIRAERVAGILDALRTKMRAQNTVAQRQEVMAILFEDTDPESATFGALGIGTQGITIADSRVAGGTDWDWKTAIDARSVYAGTIIAGILTDKLGKNSWDLDTGILTISDSFKIISGDTESAFSEIINRLDEEDANLEAIIAENEEAFGEDMSVTTQKIADLQANAEQVDLRFKQQINGGRNMIVNSSGLNGVSNQWETTGLQVTAEDTFESSSGSMFKINAATLSQTVNLIPGRQYTLTLMSKNGTSNQCYCKISQLGQDEYVFNESASGSWTDRSLTFTAQSETVTITAGTTGNSLYVADFMLVEGEQMSYWSPAANEIYTKDAKFDFEGFHITNKDSDTETLIDNEQFAIKHQGEVVLTVNKDLTVMRTTEIEGSLTIGKGKFVPRIVNGTATGLDLVLLD